MRVSINCTCNLINNLLSFNTLKSLLCLQCKYLCLQEDNKLKFLTLSKNRIIFNIRIVCSQQTKKTFKRLMHALKVVRGDVKLQVAVSLEATLVSKDSMQQEGFGISSSNFQPTATLGIRTLLR